MNKTEQCCKNCNAALGPCHKGPRLCKSCTRTEAARLKKYFLTSAVSGAIIAAVIIGALIIVKINYTPNETDYIVFNTMFFASIEGILMGISRITPQGLAAVGAILFIIPFGRFVKLDISTEGQGIVAMAVMLLELLVSLASGPVIILLNTVKLVRLSAALREEEKNATGRQLR